MAARPVHLSFQDFITIYFTEQIQKAPPEQRVAPYLEEAVRRLAADLEQARLLCLRGHWPALAMNRTRNKVVLWWPQVWPMDVVAISIEPGGAFTVNCLRVLQRATWDALVALLRDLDTRADASEAAILASTWPGAPHGPRLLVPTPPPPPPQCPTPLSPPQPTLPVIWPLLPPPPWPTL